MGTWGEGHFENDDALDWGWSLETDRDASAIGAALEPAANVEEAAEIQTREACRALAAAAVVAAAVGRPTSDELPDEARAWLRERAGAVDAQLIESAQQAVARVRRASELRDLWDEAGADEWLTRVDDLQLHLREHS